jgi:hypothetical protein
MSVLDVKYQTDSSPLDRASLCESHRAHLDVRVGNEAFVASRSGRYA